MCPRANGQVLHKRVLQGETSHMRRLIQVTLFAVLCVLTANGAFAQRVTGTLRGQVLDPAGASMANAQVTASNEDTGVSVTMTTTSAGTYSFPSILPGKY